MRFLLLLSLLAAVPSLPAQTATKAKDPVDQLAATLAPSRKLVYKKVGDRALEMHVFEPEGHRSGERRACFLTIHGGGWAGGAPPRMYPFAAHYARHGWVGISLQYRLYNPKTGISVFDCVKDVRSAMRYLRDHAGELGIDPAKIVVSGGSAGGHLAAATALFDEVNEAGESGEVTPAALVLLFPVIDTSAEGYGQAKIGERWRELSPRHRVRQGLPPTLVFHGTGDTVTPFAGAKAFHEAMRQAGNTCELDVNEGGVHGYLMFDKALFDDTLVKADAFLRAQKLLAP